MQINAAKIDEFFQRLDFAYSKALETVPSFWKQIATEIASNGEQNVYPFLSMIPGLREWLGPRIINNVAARAFTVPNKHWEMTNAIDRNKFEDDTYGFYTALMPMMAQQVAEWRDRELARVVEAGTTSLCWDGQFFFDTDHPVDPDNASAGTNSNKLVGASYDISAADPVVAFQNMRAAMMLWKREDGQQLGTLGNLIMCHANEERYARQVAEALNTPQVYGSNTAAAATSNVFMGKVDVLVNPYLTVTAGKPWYLLCTNRGINPFIWQNRQAPNFVTRTNVTDENVFKLRQYEYGVDLRGAASYSFPFLAFRGSAS